MLVVIGTISATTLYLRDTIWALSPIRIAKARATLGSVSQTAASRVEKV